MWVYLRNEFPSGGFQRSLRLGLQAVCHKLAISLSKGSFSCGIIEHGTRIGTPISAAAGHLQRQSILKHSGDRATYDDSTSQQSCFLISHPDTKFCAWYWPIMPVQMFNKAIRSL